MVKKQRKSKSENSDNGLRRLGVLIEHVDEKMGLIAEQHTGIRGDIRDIKKTQDSHTEMIGNLAVDLEIVKEDVKSTKVDVEIIKTDIEFIKNSLRPYPI